MLVGWDITIRAQRQAATDLIDESPSLRRELPEMIERVYPVARREAARELRVSEDVLPASCPFEVGEILGG